eukprot:488871-Pyramimonas_sp.AAC.1
MAPIDGVAAALRRSDGPESSTAGPGQSQPGRPSGGFFQSRSRAVVEAAARRVVLVDATAEWASGVLIGRRGLVVTN